MIDREFSLFYSDINYENFGDADTVRKFIDAAKQYSINNSKQVFLLNKVLGIETESYEYSQAIAVAVPKHKILLIDFGNDKEAFSSYKQDFINDIFYQSMKYSYIEKIKRPRHWDSHIIHIENNEINLNKDFGFSDLIEDYYVENKETERLIDLLISLTTGSINNIEKIELKEPETLLEKIEQKIILFDGEQSRFIFQPLEKKVISIQGMAGTGKTELLLHKLVSLYTQDSTTGLIGFTCFNHVLSNELKRRIPNFFNFMKVQKQIEWNEKLMVASSWGSKNDKYSGIYSYICHNYDLDFHAFSKFPSLDFNDACGIAIKELKEKYPDGVKEYCFDYILIDESQDFHQSFFDLCEIVTKKQVYIAGDIFQDIFYRSTSHTQASDYLLNNCYRTDPKTLMFAHAIGMGLYETPKLRWLTDEEWRSCGYNIEREDKVINLTRTPLRRFEDLDEGLIESVVLEPVDTLSYESKIIEIIEDLRKKFAGLSPNDVAVVFLERYLDENYNMSNRLKQLLYSHFKWESIFGWEEKETQPDKLFITNVNNIKGLEFPFIICIVKDDIESNISVRNSVYMMLTRSFITSFLITNDRYNELNDSLSVAIDEIEKYEKMILTEPKEGEVLSEDEFENLRVSSYKSQNEIIHEIIYEHFTHGKNALSISQQQDLKESILPIIKDSTDKKRIFEVISGIVSMMRG